MFLVGRVVGTSGVRSPQRAALDGGLDDDSPSEFGDRSADSNFFARSYTSVMGHPSALRCSVHEPHLYDTRDGHVLRCACCGRIQIEFRGFTLLIDVEEFETLLGTLAEVLDEIDEDASGSWCLTAPTDAGEVSLRLTVDELRALHDLLAGTQTMRMLEERIGAVAVGERRERPPASLRR